MKIKGTSRGLNRRTVVIPRDDNNHIHLQVEALRAGFTDEINKRLPDPVPPSKGVAVDRDGKILYDEKGRARQFADTSNPEYRAAAAENNRRQFSLYVVEALQIDQNVTFETKRESCANDADFADKIYQELVDWGFSEGDVALLVNEIMKASNFDEEQLREARSAFLLVQEEKAKAQTSPSSKDAPSTT